MGGKGSYPIGLASSARGLGGVWEGGLGEGLGGVWEVVS